MNQHIINNSNISIRDAYLQSLPENLVRQEKIQRFNTDIKKYVQEALDSDKIELLPLDAETEAYMSKVVSKAIAALQSK